MKRDIQLKRERKLPLCCYSYELFFDHPGKTAEMTVNLFHLLRDLCMRLLRK